MDRREKERGAGKSCFSAASARYKLERCKKGGRVLDELGCRRGPISGGRRAAHRKQLFRVGHATEREREREREREPLSQRDKMSDKSHPSTCVVSQIPD